MMDMQTISLAVDGTHQGSNIEVNSVSTDSRDLTQGSLFIALRGERFDGHKFVMDAVSKGAVGAIVENSEFTEIPHVIVNDSEVALGRLGKYWRSKFNIPLVAITGSNGKTTVKEMLFQILNDCDETLASKGNFNNTIGLPLSLLKLQQSHKFAVFELGINQIGEMRLLGNLASPTLAVITNAFPAHLEQLQSVDQVAVEKGSLLNYVHGDGVAVLNYDDPHFTYWKSVAQNRRVISFGLSADADVSATFQLNGRGSLVNLKTSIGDIEVRLNLLGVHNIRNALAATAAAIGVGVKRQHIKAGLERMHAIKGRMQTRVHQAGGQLFDDTYNANPESVAAAIEFLSNIDGQKYLVLGDMFELGDNQIIFHREIGKRAQKARVERLLAVGELSRNAVEEFGAGGKHYPNKQALINDISNELTPSTTVLIKGSRGMRMEKIADSLCTDSKPAEHRTC